MYLNREKKRFCGPHQFKKDAHAACNWIALSQVNQKQYSYTYLYILYVCGFHWYTIEFLTNLCVIWIGLLSMSGCPSFSKTVFAHGFKMEPQFLDTRDHPLYHYHSIISVFFKQNYTLISYHVRMLYKFYYYHLTTSMEFS